MRQRLKFREAELFGRTEYWKWGTIKKKDIPKSAWAPSCISCQKLQTKSGAKYLEKCWRAYQLRPSLSQSRLRALCTTNRNFINILSIIKAQSCHLLTDLPINKFNFYLTFCFFVYSNSACMSACIPSCKVNLVVSNSVWPYGLLEKAKAPHSSTLAWKIPWMEEPGRL